MFVVVLKSLLPALMILAAAFDVTSYRIPNWLTALTAAMFVPVALYVGMPMAAFGGHVLMGIALFLIGYVLFALGLFGGGDAKLMAAAGLWFGFDRSLNFLLFTGLAGGFLALVVLAMVTLHVNFEVTEASFREKFRKLTPPVPYGFALAVGAILATPGAWWMTGLA